MNKRRRIFFEKYLLYALFLLLFYIIQADPHLLYIAGIKPVLVLPFAVSVAMMDGELAGGLFGLFAGLLCDTTGNILFGFQSLIYMSACVAVGLLVIHFMQPSLINSVIFVGIVLLTRLLLEYFFYYVMWGHENKIIILLYHMLPVLAYTLLVTPPICILVKRMHFYFAARLED